MNKIIIFYKTKNEYSYSNKEYINLPIFWVIILINFSIFPIKSRRKMKSDLTKLIKTLLTELTILEIPENDINADETKKNVNPNIPKKTLIKKNIKITKVITIKCLT